jgi:very-short-patch-repair endonuclease
LDGSLFLVLGCWVPDVRRALLSPDLLDASSRLVGALLGDELSLSIVSWPVRADSTNPADSKLASALVQASRGELLAVPPAEPPSPLNADRLSDELRFELGKCDSVLQRLLFAELVRQSARPACQYRVGNYRLDLAIPASRVGLDVDGWERPGDARRNRDRNQREEEILRHGWVALRFSGKEVYENAGGCAQTILNAARNRRARSDVR